MPGFRQSHLEYIAKVNISRPTKKDADEAVRELIRRGYTVTYPVTEKIKNGRDYKTHYVAQCKKEGRD